jgi:site-specific DNA recombinase
MIAQCVDDLRNPLDESIIAERKSFIRSFVKEIKVTGDEVLLTYTMPLPPEVTLEEKTPVLYSVHPSGDRGIRTPDLRDANAALSQLSYIPITRLL